jgi:hypothetical protein
MSAFNKLKKKKTVKPETRKQEKKKVNLTRFSLLTAEANWKKIYILENKQQKIILTLSLSLSLFFSSSLLVRCKKAEKLEFQPWLLSLALEKHKKNSCFIQIANNYINKKKISIFQAREVRRDTIEPKFIRCQTATHTHTLDENKQLGNITKKKKTTQVYSSPFIDLWFNFRFVRFMNHIEINKQTSFSLLGLFVVTVDLSTHNERPRAV